MGRPKGAKNKPKSLPIIRKTFSDRIHNEQKRYATLLSMTELTPAETSELLEFSFRELRNVSMRHEIIKQNKKELEKRISDLIKSLPLD